MKYFISIFCILLIISSCSKFELKEVYKSPDSNYKLEVFIEKEYKPIASLSSESGYRKTYVVLKDINNNVIFEPDLFDSCTFQLIDFSIDWKSKEGKVYFAKFSYIDIKNKTIHCLEP